MMKKNVFLFYFILCFNQIVGQNYKATYKGFIEEINYDSIFENNKKLKKYNKDIYLKKLKKNQFDYLQASKKLNYC